MTDDKPQISRGTLHNTIRAELENLGPVAGMLSSTQLADHLQAALIKRDLATAYDPTNSLMALLVERMQRALATHSGDSAHGLLAEYASDVLYQLRYRYHVYPMDDPEY